MPALTLTDTQLAEQWLYGVLKADSTLTALIGGSTNPRLFNGIAPQDSVLPLVLFAAQNPATSRRGNHARRFGSILSYLVKAVGEGESYGSLDTIMARVDTLLDGASGSVSVSGTVVGHVLWCANQQPIAYPELVGGVQYRHLGFIYEIGVQVPYL